MRYLACTVLTLSILTSCLIGKTSTTNNGENKIDSLKQNFKPILKGVWVLTEYINEIERTKSPLKSADKLQNVVTMIIDGINQSDTIDVGASWNNHEGYHFTTYFITGQNQNQLRTNILDYDNKSNFYELGYETLNKEAYLYLYHYNKTNLLIDKKQFSKVAETQSDNDAAWGLQFIVNEELFSGNFLLVDSTNSTTKIHLKSDGSLTGHSDFKTYYVITDFIGGPETILDGIVFNLNEKNAKWFAFKINEDTTYLYSMIGDEDAGELLQLDKIQYKLVRK